MGEIVDLPVNQVRIMQNMLPRFITGMDEEVVSRYAELMEDGVEFPLSLIHISEPTRPY